LIPREAKIEKIKIARGKIILNPGINLASNFETILNETYIEAIRNTAASITMNNENNS
jgi:hypothetical protein